MEEVLFELFWIETDFAKYFAKFCNLFNNFVSHIRHFQERRAIPGARAHTCTKVFRRVINCKCK